MPTTSIPRLALCLLALALPVAGCQTGPAVTTFDGYYTGEAMNIGDGVANCPPTQTTMPMRVSGGTVSYGDFYGRVTPEGTLQMDSWRDDLTGSFKNTVAGQFGDNRFTGQLKLGPAVKGGFVCTYKLVMSR